MKAFKITKIRGGVTTPLGFRANGVYCGIKPAYPGQKSSNSKRDLALIYSEAPAVTAGFFTTNQIQAAPVKICKEFLKKNKKNTRAIIVNSGNANCCTGKQGFQTAWGTAVAIADKLNLKKTEVLLASTGIIGRQLPGDKIYKALDELINGLSASLRDGAMAAEAIMTTDTVKKEAACKIKINNKTVTIGGMAKGSGMIAPDMATMLSFITTDIKISPAFLKKAGYQALEESFNNITVDGDMSTNDTVLIMANGLAGNKGFTYNSAEYKKFCAGLTFVCIQLAKMIVADGEGATKLVDITVKNSCSKQEARTVALAIANSNLVKTMIAGGDPNWGRVISAAGAGEVKFDPEKVKLYFGKYCVFQKGQGKQTAGLKSIEKELTKKEVKITLDLNSGKASSQVYTCDLTKEYIAINAEYST